jgi:hypothetical protein
VVSGQWSVVSGQWSVVSGQWSVVSGQYTKLKKSVLICGNLWQKNIKNQFQYQKFEI